MGLLGNSLAIYEREMILFRANIAMVIARTLIIAVVYLLLFQYVGGGIVGNVPVAVINYANNQQSFQFVNMMMQEPVLHVGQPTNEVQAMNLLQSGELSVLVLIMPSFPNSPSSVLIYYSNTQPGVTSSAVSVVEEDAAKFAVPGGYNPTSVQHEVSVFSSTPVNSASGNYNDYIFPGILAVVVAFTVIYNGLALLTDRINGNIKSYLVTPIRKSAIILGKTFAVAVQSLLFIAIVLIVGFADGIPIAMGALGLLLIIPMGILVAISFNAIASAISCRSKDISSASIVIQLVAIGFWLLSGGFFPISSLPTWLQGFSSINPLTYATIGFRDIIVFGYYPIGSIILDFSVLAAFAVLTTIVSILAFKDTIE